MTDAPVIPTPTLQHEAELIRIDTLKPFKGNPRRGDVELIRESLRTLGQYRPLVVRQKTREVLAGNHTLLAAQAEGWEHVWATFVDVDAPTAKRIVAIDNRANDRAEYDNQELVALLGSLPDLAATGYSQSDLDKLQAKLDAEEPSADPVPIPETFDVLVSCGSESEQVELLERLTAEGIECRALIS